MDRNSREYHLRTIRTCIVGEELGGRRAVDRASLWRAVEALTELGDSEASIVEAIKCIQADFHRNAG